MIDLSPQRIKTTGIFSKVKNLSNLVVLVWLRKVATMPLQAAELVSLSGLQNARWWPMSQF